MNDQTFELELIQLEELFSKSRSNKYSDSRKNDFFKELYAVFNAIKSDYQSFDIDEQKDHIQIFNYLLNGLEFLDTSTLNIFPFELVFCSTKALSDWVKSDNLIIVTYLSQRRKDIYFEGWTKERVKNIKTLIKSKYKLEITNRLIRISLPKSLSKDYLAGVVLYHELGHFIDQELNITDRIFFDRYKKRPVVFSTRDEYAFYFYQKEYFADLFAAQYISDSSTNYVNHLAFEVDDTDRHPATSKRDNVVRTFLKGESCESIDLIQNALEKMGGEKLKNRSVFLDPGNSDFLKLVPQNINSVEELHGLFKLSWDFWLDSENNFLKEFSPRQKYYVVNNLIEKSISNYNVVQNWKKAKKDSTNV